MGLSQGEKKVACTDDCITITLCSYWKTIGCWLIVVDTIFEFWALKVRYFCVWVIGQAWVGPTLTVLMREPTLFVFKQCWVVTPHHKSGICNITYNTVRNCTWWHMVQWQKKCTNRNDPFEQKTTPKSNNNNKNDQEGRAGKICWHSYPIDLPTVCHHKLPTTIATLLIALSIPLSLFNS